MLNNHLNLGFVAEDSINSSLNSIQIKIRNEAFRCFHVASRSFADRQVYYLLHKMQNDKDTVKLGATNLMRHLLNSAGIFLIKFCKKTIIFII